MSSVDFSQFNNSPLAALLTFQDQPQPDFAAMLQNDPTLRQALDSIQAQQDADRAALVAADRGAIIGYGQLPDFTQLGGTPNWDTSILTDITNPETAGLANAATTSGVSTVAQNQHAANVAYANMVGSLAARQALNSGAFLSHANEAALTARTQAFNSLQSLLGGMGTNYGTYLTALGQRTADRNTAVNDALQRIIAAIQAGQLAQKAQPPQLPISVVDPTQTQPTVPVNEGGQVVQEPRGEPPAVVSGNAPNPYDMVGMSTGATSTPAVPSVDAGQVARNSQGLTATPYDNPIGPETPRLTGIPKPPSPTVAAPTVPVPGYGGRSTSGQVRRNSY